MKSVQTYSGLKINGRFLEAKPTGVQRVARQLLFQLQQHEDAIGRLFADGMTV